MRRLIFYINIQVAILGSIMRYIQDALYRCTYIAISLSFKLHSVTLFSTNLMNSSVLRSNTVCSGMIPTCKQYKHSQEEINNLYFQPGPTKACLYKQYEPWHEEINNLYFQPGPKVLKLFSCSTQPRTKFILLINVKMPTTEQNLSCS